MSQATKQTTRSLRPQPDLSPRAVTSIDSYIAPRSSNRRSRSLGGNRVPAWRVRELVARELGEPVSGTGPLVPARRSEMMWAAASSGLTGS